MNYENDYIKKIYNNLSGERQAEITEYINEAIKKELIEILEKKGFIGVDTSLEISLFEYGIVYRKKDNLTIRYQNDVYDYTKIENEDLLEIINNMKQGFYNWLGIKKEEYIQWFNTCNNKSHCIRDIFQYSDRLYEYFDLVDKSNDILRIITLLNNEKE